MALNRRLPVMRPLAGTVIAWALIGFMLSLFAAAVVPLAVGLHVYVTHSGSMAPTIDTGDLVVSRTISPAEAEVGDIVTFKDPDGGGELISHRVRAAGERDGRAYFVTRGDANSSSERWNVAESGRIGKIVYRIPKLGFAFGGIGTRAGKIVLVVLPALLLLAIGLVRIWWPDRPGGRGAEKAAP
jgi:signal peptidase I